MKLILPADIIPCGDAQNTICANGMCDKEHCQICKRHTCPVCKKHYRLAIYSGDPEGCTTACIKVTRGDTGGFVPDHIRRERERDVTDPGWRGRGGAVTEPLTVAEKAARKGRTRASAS